MNTPARLVSHLFLTFSSIFGFAFAGQGYAVSPQPTRLASLTDWLEAQAAELVKHYQHLHRHPEVSFEEKETAAYLAQLWREAGFELTTGLGGYGIVGILKNGDGPTVMLRTDLDALPVTEKTNLPYASQVQTQTVDGGQSGVMHACGHDLHMTVVTGAAQYLSAHRQAWRGTLMLVGQPAEERGSGATAMLNDGLFTRFSKPDFALALHVEPTTPAGAVAVRSGYLLANVDSVDIEVLGKGGHGASPETTVDPIVQAAELILSLQSIVSREIKPTEPAVVTVGAVHGGTKHNIIGDHCHLQITVRSYSPEVRSQLLAAIERRARGVAMSFGAPVPKIRISEGTPALENHRELTERIASCFRAALGQQRVLEAEQVMGGEDFSQYGLAGVPIMMYRLGVISPRRLEQARAAQEPLPSLHSPTFYPDLEGSLETGVASLSLAVMELAGR
jgi:amidohydrolase